MAVLDKIKIATWNVNSINQRIEHLKAFLLEDQIDIAMLQELKCQENNFPFAALESIGYNAILRCQKSYNGVAIVASCKIDQVDYLFPGDNDARYIECITQFSGRTIRLINVYVPHGESPELPKFKYKMQFYDNLMTRVSKLLKNDEILVVGGDYNIASENIDVYNCRKLDGCIGFHIDERRKLRELLNSGLFDTFRLKHPSIQKFSWWDYRGLGFQYNKGMRIDHIFSSAEGIDLLDDCYIAKKLRNLEKPSDHVPVVCVFSLE